MRSPENLERAWRTIYENGRTSTSQEVRAEISAYAEDTSKKLGRLNRALRANKFVFPQAKGVPIAKVDAKGAKTGKYRPLVLAPVESRIVQRAILNVLIRVPALGPYVKTEFSFGGIRSDKPNRTPDGHRIPRAERASAVPAAIKAVLDGMGDGARFVALADIQAFFTRISKSKVTEIVMDATGDAEFVAFFEKAISVELANMANLRSLNADWPIEDIGVAQGNSLSPLLGNMILAKFDAAMNDGDCRCVRYIDDFIILAPTLKAANARLRKATSLLAELGMSLSPEKTSKGGTPIEDGFDFLGINVCRGAIRPGDTAQTRFLTSVDNLFSAGRKTLIAARDGHPFERTTSLLGTLKKLDGMIDGWGKHYWFCNDQQTWRNIDSRVSERLKQLLGLYSQAREVSPSDRHSSLLGLTELSHLEREPFQYPKSATACPL